MKNELILDQFNVLSLNLQNNVLDYIDFLTKKYINKTQNENNNEVSDEIKKLLKTRIQDHKKNKEDAISWEELGKKEYKELINKSI